MALARDELRQALHCVSTLSTKERQALAGRVLGYRPAETAELLGVSTTSVYQALSRARTALRAALGGAALVALTLRRLVPDLRGAGAPAAAATVSVALSLALAHPWTMPPSQTPATVQALALPLVTTQDAPLRLEATMPGGSRRSGQLVVAAAARATTPGQAARPRIERVAESQPGSAVGAAPLALPEALPIALPAHLAGTEGAVRGWLGVL